MLKTNKVDIIKKTQTKTFAVQNTWLIDLEIEEKRPKRQRINLLPDTIEKIANNCEMDTKIIPNKLKKLMYLNEIFDFVG